jgi:hypothetical protein
VGHGDSPGADALAGEVARQLGLAVEFMRKEAEDYRRFRRAAWKGLNERMPGSGIDLVLAFHEGLADSSKGKGTRHLMRLAEQRGVEVRAFTE